MEVQYNKIDVYPMKIRLYPTKEQAKTIDGWLMGLQKAYNMTLYALKEGVPELRQKSKSGDAEFPNWKYIGKREWLDELRKNSPCVANVPGGCLSSTVGGALGADMRKAWESQGKLPVDAWFRATDANGRHIVRWYSDAKPRKSCFFQIEAGKISREKQSVYITLRKDFRVKARGWNDKIRFSEESDEGFFEKYRDSKKVLSLRVSRDNCGDYFATITLKDVYRPTKVEDERKGVGIDVGVRAMATDSDGRVYENPRIKQKFEDKKTELGRQLSRRYGAKNKQFRQDCKEARSFNRLHESEINEKLVDPKTVLPSRRYNQAQLKLSKLERKMRRKRDMAQHVYSAEVIRKASLVAIENLNVKGMMADSNLADRLSDAAMSELLRKLKYKAEWSGASYHAIGTFTASTQRCAKCGYILRGENKLARDDSVFVCPVCRNVDGRDANAAKSILQVAQKEISEGVPSADLIKKLEVKKTKTYPDKPIGKAFPNVFTHFSEEYKKQKRNPFVIIDENKNVLDDAQGYGYRNRQSAQKSWAHKMNQ